jgi:hypothetical protein
LARLSSVRRSRGKAPLELFERRKAMRAMLEMAGSH